MKSRVLLRSLLVCVLWLLGCRKEEPSATQQPAKANTANGQAKLAQPEQAGAPVADATVAAIDLPSSADAGTVEPVTVRFRLVDTTTIVMGVSRPSPRYGPDTEPELSFQKGKGNPEFFKLFPCSSLEMARPAFKICQEFKICRELNAEELSSMQSVLPESTRAVMACAHSAKGPAHLLALRIASGAIVVELSRTDPYEASSLKHPLCRDCPAVRLREWVETRRVPFELPSNIHVEPAIRKSRTVGVDV